MASKTLDLTQILIPDQMGTEIANKWVEWNTLRQEWVSQKEEIRKYIYATDTTTTTNKKLPWKNSTTIPKLCQIRDNLNSNYMMSLFPRRKWLFWDANEKDANSKAKRDSILNYMRWVVSQDRFRIEMQKCVLDFIDYGNAFGTIEWIDERSTIDNPAAQVGYVGPAVRRISPLDIVFNPTAPSFLEAPKIVRSLVSLGEIKKILESQSTDEDRAFYEDLYNYLINLRASIRDLGATELHVQDAYYQVDGFSSFRAYLSSDTVEILTFYGDMFDWSSKTLLPNHKIMVVDRHKVMSKKPNPSYFGFPPIFHVGWRPRQDNLWAMGPLDNLVGMQYKIDHIENMKADVLDLIAFPVLKIKGYVEDFEWEPMGRIYVGDEGDVEMVAPPFQVLQMNVEIQQYEAKMEESAGAPREAMGFRSPGEKTAYEVSRMENAASRIFNMRIIQFEEFEERLLNGCLELSRRHLDGVVSFPVWDDEFKIQTFMSLTPADITGAGRIKPMAARHFAEKAELVQNLSNLYQSALGQDPEVRMHFSSVETAKLMEDLLDIGDWEVVQPYVRITERHDAQRLDNAGQEQVMMEQQTPSGLTPEDASQPFTGGPPPAPGVPGA